MSKKIIVFLIMGFCMCSCNYYKKKAFNREVQVRNYLLHDHKIVINNPTICMFITGLSSGCQPCEEKQIQFLDTLLKIKNLQSYSKYAIFSDKTIPSSKESQYPDFKILVDTELNLQKHGIDMPYNFIIEFDGFNTLYWEWLTPNNYDLIFSHFKQ